MEPTEVVRAIETNLEGFLLEFCRTPASEVLRTPEYTQVLTAQPIGMFNLVVGTTLPSDHAASRVSEITRRFSERGVPACWWITPSNLPEDLEPLLTRSGWSLSNAWQGMERELSDAAPPLAAPVDLDVRLAMSEAEVADWLDVFQRGFGTTERLHRALTDAWRDRTLPFGLYLARRGGESLATALLYRTGRVAGIYCVCTLPPARRSGVATQLMHAVMRESQRQGCRQAIVQSTAMGKSLYRRLGFREVGRFRMFERSP